MPTKNSNKENKIWRTKLVIGIKTYSEGKTEQEAIENIFNKITKYPEIEEHLYQCKLIKGKATHPMTEKEMLTDPTDW